MGNSPSSGQRGDDAYDQRDIADARELSVRPPESTKLAEPTKENSKSVQYEPETSEPLQKERIPQGTMDLGWYMGTNRQKEEQKDTKHEHAHALSGKR